MYNDRIAGRPTYYNAGNVYRTGTRSRFYYDQSFYGACTGWLEALGEASGRGLPTAVSTLGTWVNRNDGCRSQHNFGTALDLSALWWSGRSWVADNYESDKRFYMGVAAQCNRHFKYSLDWNYNSAHHNHIHFDKSVRPSSFQTGASPQVKFVQASLNHVWNRAVTIDGAWGPQTERELEAVLAKMGETGPLTRLSVWNEYCERTDRQGMQTG
ncbi:hypothetical protein BH24ACT3_BH24ACT3_03630 [soil metagenome]